MKIFTVAIIGLGNITHKYEDDVNTLKRITYPTHLSALKKHRGYKLVAGCDVDRLNREAFGRKVTPSVTTYDNLHTMLKQEQPDLLIVATPTQTHYRIVMEALKLGVKRILCEKPIAYSTREARLMLAAAKKHKAFITFNYFRNFNPSYNQLVTKLQKREWGKILFINVLYGKGIFNTATHGLALLLKIFTTAHDVRHKKVTFPKNIDPTLDFNFFLDSILCRFRGVDPNKSFLEFNFVCQKGIVQVARDASFEYSYHYSKGQLDINLKQSKVRIDISNSMLDVYQNLYQHMTKRAKLMCTPDQALRALEIAEQAVKGK